jgi:hypothetical protein
MQRTGFKFLAGVTLNIAVFVMGGDLKAAETNICKGVEQTACQANDTCSWVRSYKTKSGTQVSAFCRKKPGKKASAKSVAPSSVTATSAATTSVTVSSSEPATAAAAVPKP